MQINVLTNYRHRGAISLTPADGLDVAVLDMFPQICSCHGGLVVAFLPATQKVVGDMLLDNVILKIAQIVKLSLTVRP